MKLDLSHSPHTKFKSDWIKALNIRATTMKLLGKNSVSFMTLDWAVISWTGC